MEALNDKVNAVFYYRYVKEKRRLLQTVYTICTSSA